MRKTTFSVKGGCKKKKMKTRKSSRMRKNVVDGVLFVVAISLFTTAGLVTASAMGVATTTKVSASGGWDSPPIPVRGQGNAGTVALNWTSSGIMTKSNSYVYCTTTINSSTPYLRFHGMNLGPGDYCIGTAQLANTGSLPLVVNQTITTIGYAECGYLFDTLIVTTTDSVGPAMNGVTYAFGTSVLSSGTIAGNSAVTVTFAIGLWADAPMTCAGHQFDYIYNVTGTVAGGDGP